MENTKPEKKKIEILQGDNQKKQFAAKKITLKNKKFNIASESVLGELREKAAKPAPKTISIGTLSDRIDHMVRSGAGYSRTDLERVIGTNDMVRINYLERGMMAAKTVSRLYVYDPTTSERWWGTGFLIAPGLLLTNNHVLQNALQAENGFAEFGYESDLNGVIKQGKRFKFNPSKGFVTSDESELDFTIVAVEEISEDGVSALSDYGFLRLDPNLHKVDELEFVTVIQHPDGGEKLIAIRENKVVKIGDQSGDLRDNFLWYASDTAPGSSGAPVFNDSWQVVAIHHSAVPLKQGDNGEYKANEGVRISSLVKKTIDLYNNLSQQERDTFAGIGELIDDATGVRPFADTRVGSSINHPRTSETIVTEARKAVKKNIHPAEYYTGRRGYNENFLGVRVSLPKLTDDALEFGKPAKLTGTDKVELKYTHFSVVHNATRKIAFFTASNIDGKKWINLDRSNDKWWFDARIPLDVQIDDALYGNEPVNGNKGWFDRGHLVRRLDPVWGTADEAALANEDTFHWTNCSPQYWGFNQGQELWQGLENYLLYNTDKENIRACVFTGPVFGKNDELHRGILIPQEFWKVIVLTDKQDNVYSSAFLVSQKRYATNIPFEVLPLEDFNHFQVSVSTIENLTGLEFPKIIQQSDVLADSKRAIGLRSLADVRMMKLR